MFSAYSMTNFTDIYATTKLSSKSKQIHGKYTVYEVLD